MRIHGAMVEAVAQKGYRGASVKQVIGLAGVSRRSFYEQFENKEDCFLATFDLIAGRQIVRIRRAYAATTGGLEERLRAVFHCCTELAFSERKVARLLLLEAQTAGPTGTLRLRRASAACEEMLAATFARSTHTVALPGPVVRAIAGGLQGALSAQVRAPDISGSGPLAEQLIEWTLAGQCAAAVGLAGELELRLRPRIREIAIAARARRAEGRADACEDERTRLAHAVLRVAVRERYEELAAPQIADEAQLPIEAFFEHFRDRDACFLAALETIGSELGELVAPASHPGADWPLTVRRTLDELLGCLAVRPLYARTIIDESCSARRETFEWSMDLARTLSSALLAGAPSPPSALRIDAVAGALRHTIRCQVASGRIALLAALADHLAYVVLSASIGAPAAVELLREAPLSAGGARAVRRST